VDSSIHQTVLGADMVDRSRWGGLPSRTSRFVSIVVNELAEKSANV
jgi:hypothetical protein